MNHLQVILNRFFPAAAEICNEILDFQPDLVMCLMHSGWLPLYAGIELWKHTQRAPFPPTIRVNLGREKFHRYDALETRPKVTSSFIGQFEEDHGEAFFLAWLDEQKHWQGELGELVQEAIGEITPDRILIVDDFVAEGATWMLALGLLSALYPTATVRFYNANIEFKGAFLEEWAERFHPQLLTSGLFPKGKSMPSSPDHRLASQMVVGTEDLDRESLRWKAIEPSDARLERLREYLPVSDWMVLPRFAERVVSDEIAAHASEYIPAPAMAKRWYPQFHPGVLILREIYRHGPLTVRQLSEHLGWSLAKARYQADRQIGRGYLVVQREERVNRVALSPQTDPEYRYSSDELDVYWVLPGRFLAGELPGHNLEGPEKERLLSRLSHLLDLGVTWFINVIYPYHDSLEDYRGELEQMAAERGTEVRYSSFQKPSWTLPRAKTIRSILDQIDRALENGHTIYLHDYHSSRVTEIVLGCYFVRHGKSGPDALRELERIREGTQHAWRRAPAMQNARRLVQRWADADPLQ
jgi:hypothetical protein